MAWRIGVDIGGTFTDVALVEETGGRIAIANTDAACSADVGAGADEAHRAVQELVEGGLT